MKHLTPYLLLLTCWPLAFYLTGIVQPTSGGWLKLAFGLSVTLATTALCLIFARWTGRENLT